MSLCIAAACQLNGRPHIVFSHDWKITDGDASSENEDKFTFVRRGWIGLMAGKQRFTDLMTDIFFDHMSAANELTNASIEPELQAARRKFKIALVERDLIGRFGMDYNTFLTKGKTAILAEQHKQIIDQMQLRLSECEMIVAGIIEDDTYIYFAEELYVTIMNNFGAIGEGADIASKWLHWRGQNEELSLKQTVLNVYEAQRFGSMAGTVGEILSLFVMNQKGEVRQIRRSFKRELENSYQNIKREKGLAINRNCFYQGTIEVAQ
jgi:hypothetical protein